MVGRDQLCKIYIDEKEKVDEDIEEEIEGEDLVWRVGGRERKVKKVFTLVCRYISGIAYSHATTGV